MFNLLKKNLFNKILVVSVFASVAFSFFLEFVFNIIPCKLCLYQRYLWIVLLFICAANILINNNKKKYIEIMILLILSIILALNFYHSGIEFGFFNNIISCSSDNNITANSIEELDVIIRNTKNMDCAFPKFHILNLSLSNLGFIISGFLFILSLKAYKKNIFN